MKYKLPLQVIEGTLGKYREQFMAGDGLALLAAIRFCFDEEIVAPEWMASAFSDALSAFGQLEVKSLDEAFGLAWPKGRHIAAAKKRRRLMFVVYMAVLDAERKGKAINDELFHKIGEPIGIGITAVKEYLAAARELAERAPLEAARALLEKSRPKPKKSDGDAVEAKRRAKKSMGE